MSVGVGGLEGAPSDRPRGHAARTRVGAARRSRRRVGIAWLPILPCLVVVQTASAEMAGDAATLEVQVPGIERVDLSRGPAGRFVYTVETSQGESLVLDPDGFARLVHGRIGERPGWQRLLNISGPIGLAWVALGLIGQLAFTGRMLVQWWASERAQRSVVPPLFWWMSLTGAAMLLVYFVWRKDVVGVLGQSAGFLIYARNLWLIRRGRAPDVAA